MATKEMREASVAADALSDDADKDGCERNEFRSPDHLKQEQRKKPLKPQLSKVGSHREHAKFAQTATTPYFAAFIEPAEHNFLAQKQTPIHYTRENISTATNFTRTNLPWSGSLDPVCKHQVIEFYSDHFLRHRPYHDDAVLFSVSKSNSILLPNMGGSFV